MAWDLYPALGLLAGAGGAARAPPAAGAAVHERRRGGDAAAEALRCGVQAYVVGGYAPARLRRCRSRRARFERENALRNAHDELAHRFEERKLVDRAKGILMRSLQIPRTKPSACCAVPDVRISSVGMVSRCVIQGVTTPGRESAPSGCACSRSASSLRALRQAASRALAHSLLECPVVQVTANLDHLARELSNHLGDLLAAAATNRWRALSRWDRDGDAAALGPIDAAAEELLVAAER